MYYFELSKNVTKFICFSLHVRMCSLVPVMVFLIIVKTVSLKFMSRRMLLSYGTSVMKITINWPAVNLMK